MAFFPMILLLFLSITEAFVNFTFDPFSKDSFAKGFVSVGNVSLNEDSVDLTINKNAVRTTNSLGKVYYNESIRFKNATTAASFSTFLTFQITTPTSGYCPGDGMAFFVQNDPTGFIWTDASMLGIEANDSKNPFLAVEFDTYIGEFDNGTVNCGLGADSKCLIGISEYSSHVGIDLNNMASVKFRCYPELAAVKQQAWIDYDAQSQLLELRMANEGNARPYNPTVSAQVNLHNLFKNSDYLHVGLSAATGLAAELHTVYSWSFNITEIESLSAPSQPGPISSPSKKHKSVTLIVVVVVVVVVVVLFLCALLSFIFCWKKGKEDAESDTASLSNAHVNRPANTTDVFS